MKGLLSKITQKGVIKSKIVYKAMIQVDPFDFIEKDPYFDNSLNLGYNVVISDPNTHACSFEYLYPFISNFNICSQKIFNFQTLTQVVVYLIVFLYKLINDQGTVVGIEHIYDLYLKWKNNVPKNHQRLLDEKNIILLNCYWRN